MYDFLLNMWIMRRINDVNLGNAVNKGYITEEQKNNIMATPQVNT